MNWITLRLFCPPSLSLTKFSFSSLLFSSFISPLFQLYFSSISLEIQMPIAHAPIRISHFPCLDRYPFLLAYILPVFRDLPTAVALQLQVPPESRRWKGKVEFTEVPSKKLKPVRSFTIHTSPTDKHPSSTIPHYCAFMKRKLDFICPLPGRPEVFSFRSQPCAILQKCFQLEANFHHLV